VNEENFPLKRMLENSKFSKMRLSYEFGMGWEL
jgi:hypothetical protein